MQSVSPVAIKAVKPETELLQSNRGRWSRRLPLSPPPSVRPPTCRAFTETLRLFRCRKALLRLSRNQLHSRLPRPYSDLLLCPLRLDLRCGSQIRPPPRA